MNLIISASLSEPPTEAAYFRELTYLAHKTLHIDCLIEVEPIVKDSYYKFLKQHGMLDDIDAIITIPEHVQGIRLYDSNADNPFIRIDGITMKNHLELLGFVKTYLNPSSL